MPSVAEIHRVHPVFRDIDIHHLLSKQKNLEELVARCTPLELCRSVKPLRIRHGSLSLGVPAPIQPISFRSLRHVSVYLDKSSLASSGIFHKGIKILQDAEHLDSLAISAHQYFIRDYVKDFRRSQREGVPVNEFTRFFASIGKHGVLKLKKLKLQGFQAEKAQLESFGPLDYFVTNAFDFQQIESLELVSCCGMDDILESLMDTYAPLTQLTNLCLQDNQSNDWGRTVPDMEILNKFLLSSQRLEQLCLRFLWASPEDASFLDTKSIIHHHKTLRGLFIQAEWNPEDPEEAMDSPGYGLKFDSQQLDQMLSKCIKLEHVWLPRLSTSLPTTVLSNRDAVNSFVVSEKPRMFLCLHGH